MYVFILQYMRRIIKSISCVHKYLHVCVYTCAYMYVCVYIYIYVHIYIYTYMYIIYIYIYIYIRPPCVYAPMRI